MVITEIKHLNVRISEFEDSIYDEKILPVFTTPIILKEVEARKRSKYKIETLNPEKKLTFKIVSFNRIVEELAARINRISENLEPHYYIDPSEEKSLPFKVRQILNKNNLIYRTKEIEEAKLRIKRSTVRNKKLILHARPTWKYAPQDIEYGYTSQRKIAVNSLPGMPATTLIGSRSMQRARIYKAQLKKKEAVKAILGRAKARHNYAILQNQNVTQGINNNAAQELAARSSNFNPNLTLYPWTVMRKFKKRLRNKLSRDHWKIFSKNWVWSGFRPIFTKEALKKNNAAYTNLSKGLQSLSFVSKGRSWKKKLILAGLIPISKGALMLLEDEGWDLDQLSNNNKTKIQAGERKTVTSIDKCQYLKNIRPYYLRKLRRLRRLRRLRLMSINLYLHRSKNGEIIQKNQECQGRNHSKLNKRFMQEQRVAYAGPYQNAAQEIPKVTNWATSLRKGEARVRGAMAMTQPLAQTDYFIKGAPGLKAGRQNNNKLNFILNLNGDNLSYSNPDSLLLQQRLNKENISDIFLMHDYPGRQSRPKKLPPVEQYTGPAWENRPLNIKAKSTGQVKKTAALRQRSVATTTTPAVKASINKESKNSNLNNNKVDRTAFDTPRVKIRRFSTLAATQSITTTTSLVKTDRVAFKIKSQYRAASNAASNTHNPKKGPRGAGHSSATTPTSSTATPAAATQRQSKAKKDHKAVNSATGQQTPAYYKDKESKAAAIEPLRMLRSAAQENAKNINKKNNVSDTLPAVQARHQLPANTKNLEKETLKNNIKPLSLLERSTWSRAYVPEKGVQSNRTAQLKSSDNFPPITQRGLGKSLKPQILNNLANTPSPTGHLLQKTKKLKNKKEMSADLLNKTSLNYVNYLMVRKILISEEILIAKRVKKKKQEEAIKRAQKRMFRKRFWKYKKKSLNRKKKISAMNSSVWLDWLKGLKKNKEEKKPIWQKEEALPEEAIIYQQNYLKKLKKSAVANPWRKINTLLKSSTPKLFWSIIKLYSSSFNPILKTFNKKIIGPSGLMAGISGAGYAKIKILKKKTRAIAAPPSYAGLRGGIKAYPPQMSGYPDTPLSNISTPSVDVLYRFKKLKAFNLARSTLAVKVVRSGQNLSEFYNSLPALTLAQLLELKASGKKNLIKSLRGQASLPFRGGRQKIQDKDRVARVELLRRARAVFKNPLLIPKAGKAGKAVKAAKAEQLKHKKLGTATSANATLPSVSGTLRIPHTQLKAATKKKAGSIGQLPSVEGEYEVVKADRLHHSTLKGKRSVTKVNKKGQLALQPATQQLRTKIGVTQLQAPPTKEGELRLRTGVKISSPSLLTNNSPKRLAVVEGYAGVAKPAIKLKKITNILKSRNDLHSNSHSIAEWGISWLQNNWNRKIKKILKPYWSRTARPAVRNRKKDIKELRRARRINYLILNRLKNKSGKRVRIKRKHKKKKAGAGNAAPQNYQIKRSIKRADNKKFLFLYFIIPILFATLKFRKVADSGRITSGMNNLRLQNKQLFSLISLMLGVRSSYTQLRSTARLTNRRRRFRSGLNSTITVPRVSTGNLKATPFLMKSSMGTQPALLSKGISVSGQSLKKSVRRTPLQNKTQSQNLTLCVAEGPSGNKQSNKKELAKKIANEKEIDNDIENLLETLSVNSYISKMSNMSKPSLRDATLSQTQSLSKPLVQSERSARTAFISVRGQSWPQDRALALVSMMATDILEFTVSLIAQSLFPLKRKKNFYSALARESGHKAIAKKADRVVTAKHNDRLGIGQPAAATKFIKILKASGFLALKKKNKKTNAQTKLMLAKPSKARKGVSSLSKLRTRGHPKGKVGINFNSANSKKKKEHYDYGQSGNTLCVALNGSNNGSAQLNKKGRQGPLASGITSTPIKIAPLGKAAKSSNTVLRRRDGENSKAVTVEQANRQGRTPQAGVKKQASITFYSGGRYLSEWKRVTKVIWQENYKFNAVYRRINNSLKIADNNLNFNLRDWYAITTIFLIWKMIKLKMKNRLVRYRNIKIFFSRLFKFVSFSASQSQIIYFTSSGLADFATSDSVSVASYYPKEGKVKAKNKANAESITTQSSKVELDTNNKCVVDNADKAKADTIALHTKNSVLHIEFIKFLLLKTLKRYGQVNCALARLNKNTFLKSTLTALTYSKFTVSAALSQKEVYFYKTFMAAGTRLAKREKRTAEYRAYYFANLDRVALNPLKHPLLYKIFENWKKLNKIKQLTELQLNSNFSLASNLRFNLLFNIASRVRIKKDNSPEEEAGQLPVNKFLFLLTLQINSDFSRIKGLQPFDFLTYNKLNFIFKSKNIYETLAQKESPSHLPLFTNISELAQRRVAGKGSVAAEGKEDAGADTKVEADAEAKVDAVASADAKVEEEAEARAEERSVFTPVQFDLSSLETRLLHVFDNMGVRSVVELALLGNGLTVKNTFIDSSSPVNDKVQMFKRVLRRLRLWSVQISKLGLIVSSARLPGGAATQQLSVASPLPKKAVKGGEESSSLSTIVSHMSETNVSSLKFNNKLNKSFNNLVFAKSTIIGKIRSIKLVELIDKLKEDIILEDKLAALVRVDDITDLNYLNKKKYRRINASKYLNKKKINRSNRIKILQTIEIIKTDFRFEPLLDGNSLSNMPVSLLYYSNLKPSAFNLRSGTQRQPSSSVALKNWKLPNANFNKAINFVSPNINKDISKNSIGDKTSVQAMPTPNMLSSAGLRQRTTISTPASVAATHKSFTGIRYAEDLVRARAVKTPVLSSYLRELSIYNRETKGTIKYFSKIISYNFNTNTNKISNTIYDLLKASFLAMHCLISKPVFVITPKKVKIQLFYFFLVPDKKQINNVRYKFKRDKRKRKAYSNSRLKLAKKLNELSLNYLNSKQFDLLCGKLNKVFNKRVVFNLVRLHYPSEDTNILANLFGYLVNKVRILKIIKKTFKGSIIKTLTNIKKTKYNDISIIPAFLTGLSIKVAGRIMTQKIKPRKTINQIRRGATATGKINYLNFSRLTKKNKRGSYSITILAGHNYFK